MGERRGETRDQKPKRINKKHCFDLTMINYTQPTKGAEIQREWYLIDVKDETLGRIATRIAQLLQGKGKAHFVRHLDVGDRIVVINAGLVKVTGKKLQQKQYTRYSGYPGGLKKEQLRNLLARKPEEVIRKAVAGMLPKNRLRKRLLRRLYVYSAAKHPFADKFQPEANAKKS